MSNFKNQVEGPKELGGCKLANPNPIVIDVNRLKTVKSITQSGENCKPYLDYMRPKDLGAHLGVMTHKRVILQKSIVSNA